MKPLFTFLIVSLLMSFSSCKKDNQISTGTKSVAPNEIEGSSQDWDIEIESYGCFIIEYLGADLEVTFPTYVDGHKVVRIGLPFYAGQQVFGGMEDKILTMDLSHMTYLSSISVRSFSGCSSLYSVILPNSLEQIGDQVFFGCNKLEMITLPNKLTVIGDGAFGACGSLLEITIPDSVWYIGASAFVGCTSLVDVKLNTGLEIIMDLAFSGCTELKSITFPESLTSIRGGAFAGCSSLSTITLKKTSTPLTSIDQSNVFPDPWGATIYYPSNADYPNETGWSDLGMVTWAPQ